MDEGMATSLNQMGVLIGILLFASFLGWAGTEIFKGKFWGALIAFVILILICSSGGISGIEIFGSAVGSLLGYYLSKNKKKKLGEKKETEK